jgi:hypothetical protein
MKNNSLKSALMGAGIFGGCGLLFLAESFYTKLTRTFISAGKSGAAAMSPKDGLIVAFLFFAVAAYSLFLAYRARKKGDE